jgi:hypothetical protein
LLSVTGCSLVAPIDPTPIDGAVDAGGGLPPDAGAARVDGGSDGGGGDASVDAGIDAGVDVRDDGGVDAGTDAGLVDAGHDAGPAFPYAVPNYDAQLATAIGPDATLNCGTTTFDTSELSFDNWCGEDPQASALVELNPDGGPPLVALNLSSLNVTANSTLRVVGDRAALIAVWGDANISGAINASTRRTGDPGAGADPAVCGDVGGTGADGLGEGAATDNGGGGGGGSFGGAGGAGGAGASGLAGGDGGVVNGDDELVPLRGGCPGGSGGDSTIGSPGAGGRGGGAVQLSVARVLNLRGATLVASGAGGGGGNDQSGGGGGGSGGAILVTTFDFEGEEQISWLTNGGGGAEGGGNPNDGNPGQSGSLTEVGGGNGGGGGAMWGGSGGDGAGASPDGEAGAEGNTGFGGGGGGGGGHGRVRFEVHGACLDVSVWQVAGQMTTWTPTCS